MRRPPIRISQDDLTKLAEPGVEAFFMEHFGTDFAAHEACGFVTAPSDDNKMFGLLFQLPAGGLVRVSLKRELMLELATALAVTWQHLSDSAMLEGTPGGSA